MRCYFFFLIFITQFYFFNANAQKIECFILKAPEKAFYDIQKIGVLEFQCTNNYRFNNKMTDLIIGNLLDQYRGIVDGKSKLMGLKPGKEGQTYVKGVKTDFYQVIEREQLKKIMQEQRLSLSGAIDENSAAEVGKVLGLDVIIMGSISYTSNDERGSSLLSSTSNCLKRTVTMNGTMKIVSVETAQIVGTKTAQSSIYENKCDDQRSAIKSVEEYAEILLNSIASQFTDYFTPGYQLAVFEFEKIKLKDFKDQSKEAEDYLGNGDLDKAFPIFYAMYQEDSYNPKAAYNLGALYEMVGAYEDAFEYYSIAYELDFSNEKFKIATERASAGLKLTEYLNEVGRPVQQYSFTGGSNALAERIKVKGSDADRVQVYLMPDKSSEIVAKVPGGIEFKVLREDGKFYEIQLMGSKTGFIDKSDVK